MDEHAHHVLWAELVLVGKFPVMPGGIDEQDMIVAFPGAVLAQNQQAGRQTRAIEHIEREGDHSVDQSPLQ